MVILPTLGRPKQLARFIEAYHVTCASSPVAVFFDAADPSLPEYDKIDYPGNFIKVSVPAGTRLPEIQNLAFKHFPNRPWYGFVGDDCLPMTRDWDVLLAAACKPMGIAWPDDGIQGEKLATHPFIDGDLVRLIGWITPPGFVQYYTDNVLTDIARDLNRAMYMPNIKLMHMHHINGMAEMDATYARSGSMEQDRDAYINFRTNVYPHLIERLRLCSSM